MGQTRPVSHFVLVAAALAAPLLFPLSFTVVLALMGAVISPFVPLVVGIILDALYWSHNDFSYPLYTLVGALMTLAAFFVHRFVETSIMRS